jgi:cephalosporin hydroxylase
MINEHYAQVCAVSSDINEHLPTLKRYAEQSETVVELGMRKIVSTWAFLAGKPKQLISVDITHPRDYGADLWEVEDAAREAGIEFDFVLKSSLEIDLPEHDFLFIDTLHTYDQLTAELERHHPKVKKFIAMHDTNLSGDPDNMRGAVNDFLDRHREWEVAEHFDNNNGLTILKRV